MTSKPWIRVIRPPQAEGRLKEIYDDIREKRGKIAEIHIIHSLHPESLLAHMDLYLTLMFGRSPLHRRERELLGVATSAVNACDYCVAHHSDALARYEKRQAYIRKVQQRAWEDLEPRDRALCRFAEKLTRTPWAVKMGDLEALQAHGYDDTAILDIVQIIAYFNFVNRLVLGLGVPLESDEERQGYRY